MDQNASSSHGISSGANARISVASGVVCGASLRARPEHDQDHAIIRLGVHADERNELDVDLDLLHGFPVGGILDRLAEIDEPARERPPATPRIKATADEHHAAVGVDRNHGRDRLRVVVRRVAAVRADDPTREVAVRRLAAARTEPSFGERGVERRVHEGDPTRATRAGCPTGHGRRTVAPRSPSSQMTATPSLDSRSATASSRSGATRSAGCALRAGVNGVSTPTWSACSPRANQTPPRVLRVGGLLISVSPSNSPKKRWRPAHIPPERRSAHGPGRRCPPRAQP